jgi:adenylate cyclase
VSLNSTSAREIERIAASDLSITADEEDTHKRVKAHFRELIDPKVSEHLGRIVKNTGDGLLAEFPSVVDAVRCAAEIQHGIVVRNVDVPDDKRISFRIGVNLGDIIVEPEDIFGDDVNIASRLEALAEPGGICISRAVRDRIGERLPYSFEDIGEQSVKSIAHPVHVYRIRLKSEAKARQTGMLDTEPKPSLCLPDKASIAVLPFQNMSGDPEQDYFADGMVEEIITALSRIRWLFVIARNSSFTYKGRAVDVKQVGRELGVCYVLEGSVRKTRDRVRISAQLIDALSGAHLWADRFEGSLEDVFQLQDNVALSVAGVIEPALQAAETACTGTRPTTDLTAYDLYLRPLRTHTFFGFAIETDVHYGLCHETTKLPERAESDHQCNMRTSGGTRNDKATTRKNSLGSASTNSSPDLSGCSDLGDSPLEGGGFEPSVPLAG